MKLFIVCALLPMAMCLPSFLNEDKLKADMQFLAQKFVSSDLTRKACEAECQKYITSDSDKEFNVAFGCPLACMGLQSELEKLVSPDQHSKRSLLDFFKQFSVSSLFDVETLKQDFQLLLDVVGSDSSEQVCETGCHHMLQQGHVLNFGCPLACRSLQTAVNFLHLKRDPTTTAVPTTTA